jgi:hypothetical protein
MGSVPAGSAEVLNVAVLLTPPPGVSVALPRDVAPFMKVTDPVGAALPLETVAVKVTVCPLLAGFSDEVTVAVVLAPLITWLSAGEVAAPKFAVPAYTTVIESVPTGRDEVERVAVLLTPPPAVSVALPREVAPFINVTEPVGAVVLLVSVAVKVTDWPALAGFSEDTTAAVLLAALTTWLSVGEVAAPKFAVAAYTTVSESVPTGRVEIASVAVLLRPLLGLSVALPIDVAPLMNVTEPVGAA